MKTIVLKFSGPLQSWGIGSHFENRDTSKYPTKSAVIGLIAGALGYRRDETAKIQELNNLSFGVRVEQIGTILRDFHIAKSQKQSYVTNRYYLQDAVFAVMISHKDSNKIDAIVKSLEQPDFAPYLGRRSVPVNSDYIQDVLEDDLLSVIKSYPWLASEWYQKKFMREEKADEFIELDALVDGDLIDDGTPSIYNRDKVESFAFSYRNHQFRAVKAIRVKIPVEAIEEATEHDAFQSIGG